MRAEQPQFTLPEAVKWVADLAYTRSDAESAIRSAGIDDQIRADGLLVGSEAQGRKPLPSIAWLKGPIDWEKSQVANFTDVRIEREWLQVRFAPWPALESDATKPGTILFSKLASEIAALASSGHTAETALALLVKDAVLGAFAQLGWNMHAHRLRRDHEEYLRHARRRLVDDEGRPFGITYHEYDRFHLISPMTIVEQLSAHWPLNDAQRAYNEKIKESLNLPERVLLSRVANEPLPEEESESRIFLEALAITIEEAQGFCARHHLAVPNAMLSPTTVSPTAPLKTPDHSMKGDPEVEARAEAATRAETPTKAAAPDLVPARPEARKPHASTRKLRTVIKPIVAGLFAAGRMAEPQEELCKEIREAVRKNPANRDLRLPKYRQGLWPHIKAVMDEVCNEDATKSRIVAQQKRASTL